MSRDLDQSAIPLFGRDPRRRPTVTDRREIYQRAGGSCGNCGAALGHDYHNAHMAAWKNGGTTNPDNVRAECAGCNLTNGARDVDGWEGVQLRDWQRQALPIILERLWHTGVATINAAPGAGKTLFAVAVFRALAEAGFVERLVIVSPNLAIVGQWKRSAGRMRVHLDDRPRDSHLEYQGTAGMVITYHVLPGVAELHKLRLDTVPTLVVFDEVHHLGESKSWADAVARMVGDVARGIVHPAAVLNMTGTLFRSGRDKRISTVRYDTVHDDVGEVKLVAQADWTITTADLVGVELRAPNLYVYDSHATLMDWREEKVVSGAIGDLDQQARAAVLRGLDTSAQWLRGFAQEGLRLLHDQIIAAGGNQPLKLLYCASNQQAARQAAKVIDELAGPGFARLVVSADGDRAKKELEDAAAQPKSCAIVQVKMATEGFDCPQIATILYASNVTADLSIAQTIARAMRITDWERGNNQLLPAQVLIPDNPDLRAAFAAVLSTVPRHIDLVEQQAGDDDQHGVNGGVRDGALRRRFQLMDLSGPQLDAAEVLGHDDGRVEAADLTAAQPELTGLGIPNVFHPNVIVYGRRQQHAVWPGRAPATTRAAAATMPSAPTSTVTITEPNPRDLNTLYRQRIAFAHKWMAVHHHHDARYANPGQFNGRANDAAEIPNGGRPDASADQLRICFQWMCDRIIEHCRTHDEQVPEWAE